MANQVEPEIGKDVLDQNPGFGSLPFISEESDIHISREPQLPKADAKISEAEEETLFGLPGGGRW